MLDLASDKNEDYDNDEGGDSMGDINEPIRTRPSATDDCDYLSDSLSLSIYLERARPLN